MRLRSDKVIHEMVCLPSNNPSSPNSQNKSQNAGGQPVRSTFGDVAVSTHVGTIVPTVSSIQISLILFDGEVSSPQSVNLAINPTIIRLILGDPSVRPQF